MFAGWMNIITAPFIATYFLLVFLLRNVHVSVEFSYSPKINEFTLKHRILLKRQQELVTGSTHLWQNGSFENLTSCTIFST